MPYNCWNREDSIFYYAFLLLRPKRKKEEKMSSKRNGRKTIHANQISREGGNGIWFLWLLVISSTSNTNQMSWSKVGMVYVLWRLAISSTSSSISNTGVSFRMLKWLVKGSHFQSLSDSFSPKHDEKELGWVFRSSPVLHTAMIHSCSQAVYDPTNYIRHGDWAKYSTVICLLPVKNEKKRNKDEDANQDLYNHSKNKTIAIYQKPQLNLRGRHLCVHLRTDIVETLNIHLIFIL